MRNHQARRRSEDRDCIPKTFVTARYDGKCGTCAKPWEPGDSLVRMNGRLHHESCAQHPSHGSDG